MSIENPTLAHFRHFSHFRHSSNYNIFPNTLIMQNKANFGNAKMNITLDMTMNYKLFIPLEGQKNKANSNPIKPISKPIKANSKPKQTQFKPNLSRRNPEQSRIKHPQIAKKKNFLPIALFPLTSSTARYYNRGFSQISCSQRTPIERSWK